MGFHKGHHEFHTLDMQDGWHHVPGYPPGFSEKILAGSLDEKNKRGNRTRLLRIEAGAYSTVPFVHEYWEEVFLLSGDLICGNDEQGLGGEQFKNYTTRCGRPASIMGRSRRRPAACCSRRIISTRRRCLYFGSDCIRIAGMLA